jgi:hypothetical protein
MDERTQIIRSLDQIGAAGMRFRGDIRASGGAEVCDRQARGIRKSKPAAHRAGINGGATLERNNGMRE